MFTALHRYANWLHTQWPAGRVEKYPDVRPDGSTSLPSLYVTGDLTGIPLLKYAADSGAKTVRTIAEKIRATPSADTDLDLVIIGAGVSGIAAALEAQKLGLKFDVIEANEPFSTVSDFPNEKPIFLYPTEMNAEGLLKFTDRSGIKEGLLSELRDQLKKSGIPIRHAEVDHVQRASSGKMDVVFKTGDRIQARFVIAALGKTGAFRKIAASGVDLSNVHYRLHDPFDFKEKNAIVIGGGDSALETALLLARAGARVTLVHRQDRFSRPKSDLIESLEQTSNLHVRFRTEVKEINLDSVTIRTADGNRETIPNDVVFSMTGRDAPLDFFRRSRVRIRGEWTPTTWLGLFCFLAFSIFLFHWKTDNAALPIYRWFEGKNWFPFNVPDLAAHMSTRWMDLIETRGTLLRTVLRSAMKPAFYYSLVYSLVVIFFGIRRIRSRKNKYVTKQTLSLIAFQVLPMFVLPEILLPWAGDHGWFLKGSWLGNFADQFFEPYDLVGYDRAYWRSYGFVLAWPLFIWNVFTNKPMWGWLIVSILQTFVAIPLLVWKYGKGAYCGWICSCGALAETLGDGQRRKMPHGPFWNRLNFLGQIILGIAFLLALLRIGGWIFPGSWTETVFMAVLKEIPILNYAWFVDLFLSGILGVGLYFWFSGRTWCRFACPLAALMHIYARFSRFRILADKKKCISCNECTSVCHQGIDVMSFANKGLPMADPQCVRCNACIQACPTDVLSFGELDPKRYET